MPENHERIVVEAATLREDGCKVLACPKAFALAREQGLTLKQIGGMCEEAGIKIVQCQLGCFR